MLDCHVWLYFLQEAAINPRRLCRPFIDFRSNELTSETLAFYSDASRNAKLGFGCTFKNKWISRAWNQQFIEDCEPSIEFLELYALTVAVFAWDNQKEMKNGSDNLLRQSGCGSYD